MVDPKRKLKGMLARIFSDGAIDGAERDELRAFLTSGALTAGEVKEVFRDFVETTWKVTTADGVVSEHERKRLDAIASVLGIEAEALPAEWVFRCGTTR
jgi:tellurite resistance protein